MRGLAIVFKRKESLHKAIEMESGFDSLFPIFGLLKVGP